MLLKLFTIPEGRSVLSQKIVWEGEQAEWLKCPEGLMCRAEVDRMQSQIAVHVVYNGAVLLECSRCLTTYSHPVSGDFHVILRDTTDDKKNIDEVDDFGDYDYNDTTDDLDIRDAIFDDVVTALPMIPRCSDTCPGIAPGYIVDDSDAAKASGGVDTRWEALKKLKNQH
jgi:uncharacterized protein